MIEEMELVYLNNIP